MSEKRLSVLIRFAIVLSCICGLLYCLFWIPISVGVTSLRNIPWREVGFCVQYIFHWAVSLPCFWLLVLAWKVSITMNKEKLFLGKNSIYARNASVILAVDIIVFLIGNIIFALIGWNSWLILHFLFAATGVVICIFMYVLSKYLLQAAVLQEESDLTV